MQNHSNTLMKNDHAQKGNGGDSFLLGYSQSRYYSCSETSYGQKIGYMANLWPIPQSTHERPCVVNLSVPQTLNDNYRFNIEKISGRNRRIKRIQASLESSLGKHYPGAFSHRTAKHLIGRIQDLIDSSDVQTFTDSTQLATFFALKLKKYVKMSKEDRIDEDLPVDLLKDLTYEETDATLELRMRQNPKELLEEAKNSSSFSKVLVKVIQSKNDEEVQPFVKIISSSMAEYVDNENTCYLVKFIIKNSDIAMKKALNLVVNRLDEMLTKVHTCRLVYTMCNHSLRFREMLLISYKSRLMKLLATVPGAILLSLLISNYSDLSKFDFILEELQKNNEVIKMPYFSRAFATYMNRCSMATLSEISAALAKHLPFLLQDNYGNYLLQIFYERDCQAGVSCCNDALKKMQRKAFVRKYSRYVLFKALDHKSGPGFARDILEMITEDCSALEPILLKKFSKELLLYCLARVDDKEEMLLLFEKAIETKISKYSNQKVSIEIHRELIHDLAVLKRFTISEKTK